MHHQEDPERGRLHADIPSAGDRRVRARLVLGGVSVSFAGRRTFFERHVLPLLEGMYTRARAGEAASRAEATAAAFHPTSPQRFQQYAIQVGANAATVEQRVMAFAFYLWNYEKRDTFDEATIASFFRTVQEAPPEDLAGLLAALRDGKRWLDAGEADDTWRLTTKGVNYVKNRLLGGT